MRLGQLSRKLGIHTSKIVDFLASKDITISEDSNARIEDEYVTWVTQKYAPQLMTEVNTTLSEEKIEPISIQPPVVEEVPFTEEQPIPSEEPLIPELIKAPKIELSGLKVLGKIEIPEKKKKETTTDHVASEISIAETESKVQPDRRTNTSRREYEERPRKNPIALQRERETREVEKTRQEERLRLKDKKAQHYQSKVKVQVATKRMNRIEEPLEKIETPIEMEPTTMWGKFKKWLRT